MVLNIKSLNEELLTKYLKYLVRKIKCVELGYKIGECFRSYIYISDTEESGLVVEVMQLAVTCMAKYYWPCFHSTS